MKLLKRTALLLALALSTIPASLAQTLSAPQAKSGSRLSNPVSAADFELDSPNGRYMLSRYRANGVVLIFGRTTCGNTLALLHGLSGDVEALYGAGVDVLVSLEGLRTPEDVDAMAESCPGYHYAYTSGVFWDLLDAVGYADGPVAFPCVFVIDRNAKITYYSLDRVTDIAALTLEARAVATGNPLPGPEKHADLTSMLNGQGNINDIENGETIVSALRAAAGSHIVLLLMDENVNDDFLTCCESHSALLDRLGIAPVAACVNLTDAQKRAYPHVAFAKYSDSDFWSLLWAAGYSSMEAAYATSMLIEKGGDIAAFTNGSLLDPAKCLVYAARKLEYDATVPADLERIEQDAFTGAGFRRLDLTNGALHSIASGAFAESDDLEFVRIPETVTDIGDGAFTGSSPVIVCTVGTAAHRYALKNGLEYICE